MEAEKFIKKLGECTSNFRKTQMDTADDQDLAHFFDPKLKKFLLDNKKTVDALFELKNMSSFQKFVTGYVWKGR